MVQIFVIRASKGLIMNLVAYFFRDLRKPDLVCHPLEPVSLLTMSNRERPYRIRIRCGLCNSTSKFQYSLLNLFAFKDGNTENPKIYLKISLELALKSLLQKSLWWDSDQQPGGSDCGPLRRQHRLGGAGGTRPLH